MDNAGIETNLPKIIKPGDFKEIDDLQVIYSGLLRKYNSSKVDVKELLRNNLLYPKKEGIIWVEKIK